jgi:hypothetical protein
MAAATLSRPFHPNQVEAIEAHRIVRTTRRRFIFGFDPDVRELWG